MTRHRPSRHRPWFRHARALAVLPALLVTSPAAATPSARLVYVRGEGTAACPDETELRREVARRLGYDPFFPTAPKTVIAEIARDAASAHRPGAYRGRVQIVSDAGELRGDRRIASTGDDCRELTLAMALAVSIAIDDFDEPKASPPTDEPSPPAHTSDATEGASAPPIVRVTPAPRPESDREPARPQYAERPLELRAGLGPTVSFGTGPAPAIGLGAGATLTRRPFAVRLGGRFEMPSSGDVVSAVRVTTSTAVATLAACAEGVLPFVCVGGGTGVLRSRTEGIERPASDSALLALVMARAGARLTVAGNVELEPYVELAGNLTPHRVEVDGVSVFTMPAILGTLGAQLGWRFF